MFSVSSNRGGIGIRVIFVLITLVVVGICVYSLLEVQKESIRRNHRIAAELSDLGLQQALEANAEIVQTDPRRFAPVPRTTAQNGWYEVAVTLAQVDSVMNISLLATGVSGSEKVVQTRMVRLTRRGSDSLAIWEP